jgi:hypothetical protein
MVYILRWLESVRIGMAIPPQGLWSSREGASLVSLSLLMQSGNTLSPSQVTEGGKAKTVAPVSQR